MALLDTITAASSRAASSVLDLDVSDHVATVVMKRPPANAINVAWTHEFNAILDNLEARDDWNILHVRSELSIFSAGADIKEMRAAFEAQDVEPLVLAVRHYQRLFARIEALPQITLAEISGAAMGGGFELALACDFRIIADEALVGLPEIRIGLLAGAGGTQRLTRLCGRATALRILLAADMVGGREAVRLGMAQWHAPASELRTKTADIVRRLADHHSTAGQLAKACVKAALDPHSSDGFDLEYEGSRQLLNGPVTQALVAEFLSRRNPPAD